MPGAELQRLRKEGAEYLVVLWSSFWWEDGFPEFYQYLRSYRPLLRNEEVLILDLREKVGVQESSEATVATHPGVDEII